MLLNFLLLKSRIILLYNDYYHKPGYPPRIMEGGSHQVEKSPDKLSNFFLKRKNNHFRVYYMFIEVKYFKTTSVVGLNLYLTLI